MFNSCQHSFVQSGPASSAKIISSLYSNFWSKGISQQGIDHVSLVDLIVTYLGTFTDASSPQKHRESPLHHRLGYARGASCCPMHTRMNMVITLTHMPNFIFSTGKHSGYVFMHTLTTVRVGVDKVDRLNLYVCIANCG